MSTATEKEVEVEILINELYFSLECQHGMNLEGVSLPRFDCTCIVERGYIKGCSPPSEGYAALLHAVNVMPKTNLTLSDLPAANLSRAHFTNLTSLRELNVRHMRRLDTESRVHVATDFLSPLNTSLRTLTLMGVALTSDTLRALPQELVVLEVNDAALECEDGCAAALQRLQQLQTLRLTDKQLHNTPALSAAAALRDAYVIAPVRQPLLSNKTAIEKAVF